MERMPISERMNRKLLKDTNMRNKSHKLPLILILDTSGSMKHNDNIGKLNDGVQSFYREILADSITQQHLEVCLITFGEGGVKSVLDFGNPAQQQVPVLQAGGSSPLCTAITMGLDLLEDQIDIYNGKGIASHPPVMVILTDGEPTTTGYDERGVPIMVTKDTSDFKITKEHYNYFKKNMKLASHSIYFGDEIENTFFLYEFASSAENVKKLDEINIIKFFKILGKSASALTKAAPGMGNSLEIDVDLFEEIAAKKK